jgi:RNA polymerase sigma-70 factor (ECF subfamily)
MADTPDLQQQDAEAVKAVLGGEPERYEEIVRRHEKRIYAVAWSRLGNAALAEEAAQQAFIRGYTQLSQLKDEAKVGSWIGAMARNIAINLFLMHRREMDKRERWSLQQTVTTEGDDEDSSAPCTPKTLREALAELSASQRECLVLFYLEGKSNAEAAIALGISEATFRVKLHRARASLRKELDDRLANSLQELRPVKSLSVIVMAGIFASSPSVTVGAVGGAAAGGGYAASTMTTGSTWMSMKALVSLGWTLPWALITWWIERREAANFTDQQGFRAKLYRLETPSLIGYILIIGLLMWFGDAVVGPFIDWTISSFKEEKQTVSALGFIFGNSKAIGFQPVWYIVSFFSGISALYLFRLYQNGPNRFWGILFFGAILMTVVSLFAGIGWLPTILTVILLPAIMLLTTYALRFRPMKMDYNLFLRSSQGMLKAMDREVDESPAPKMTDGDLVRFARFLGSRFLTFEQGRSPDGLRLFLMPVRRRFIRGLLRWIPSIKNKDSHIIMHSDGNVTAMCSEVDAHDIAAFSQDGWPAIEAWESHVENAVQNSLRLFLTGQHSLAEHAIGEVAESEIFVKPVSKAPVARWLWIIDLFGTMIDYAIWAFIIIVLLLLWYFGK